MSLSNEPTLWSVNAQTMASLVIDKEGSFQVDGNSRALSGNLDRMIFLSLRRQADRIFSSRKTIEAEGYSETPNPKLSIVTRSKPADDGTAITLEELLELSKLKSQKLFLEFGPTLLAMFASAGGRFDLQLNVTSRNVPEDDASDLMVQLGFRQKLKIVKNLEAESLTGFRLSVGGSS